MIDRRLTLEEIRMLADVERRMESGEQPHVVTDGGKLAVNPLVMEEFGLQVGQPVSGIIAMEIIRAHLAWCKAEIALKRGKP